jgi:hypothetical protein
MQRQQPTPVVRDAGPEGGRRARQSGVACGTARRWGAVGGSFDSGRPCFASYDLVGPWKEVCHV